MHVFTANLLSSSLTLELSLSTALVNLSSIVDNLLKNTCVKPIEVATMALPAAITSDSGISIETTPLNVRY
jgi:hypothetical protein